LADSLNVDGEVILSSLIVRLVSAFSTWSLILEFFGFCLVPASAGETLTFIVAAGVCANETAAKAMAANAATAAIRNLRKGGPSNSD
jgi:hypothetical protein